MSYKETTVNVRVCDWCGKPLGDHAGVEDVVVKRQLDSEAAPCTVSVRVITGDLDLHERCRNEVIAEAARQVGTRKPRGRAAHKAAAPEASAPPEVTAPETPGAGDVETGKE